MLPSLFNAPRKRGITETENSITLVADSSIQLIVLSRSDAMCDVRTERDAGRVHSVQAKRQYNCLWEERDGYNEVSNTRGLSQV